MKKEASVILAKCAQDKLTESELKKEIMTGFVLGHLN